MRILLFYDLKHLLLKITCLLWVARLLVVLVSILGAPPIIYIMPEKDCTIFLYLLGTLGTQCTECLKLPLQLLGTRAFLLHKTVNMARKIYRRQKVMENAKTICVIILPSIFRRRFGFDLQSKNSIKHWKT